MSHLTRCNRCTLTDMQARARARGVEVVVVEITNPVDPAVGWTSARYSDQESPSTWFQVLPSRCAC